jgi:hypothetical protein
MYFSRFEQIHTVTSQYTIAMESEIQCYTTGLTRHAISTPYGMFSKPIYLAVPNGLIQSV